MTRGGAGRGAMPASPAAASTDLSCVPPMSPARFLGGAGVSVAFVTLVKCWICSGCEFDGVAVGPMVLARPGSRAPI